MSDIDTVVPLVTGAPRPGFAEELLAALRIAALAEVPSKARFAASRWLIAGGVAGAGVVASVWHYQKRRSA